eukprot:5275698-Amphidinium_carterae.1
MLHPNLCLLENGQHGRTTILESANWACCKSGERKVPSPEALLLDGVCGHWQLLCRWRKHLEDPDAYSKCFLSSSDRCVDTAGPSFATQLQTRHSSAGTWQGAQNRVSCGCVAIA